MIPIWGLSEHGDIKILYDFKYPLFRTNDDKHGIDKA
jgi:hypothetical protein